MRRAGFDEVDNSHDVYVDALLPGFGSAVHAHWGGEWVIQSAIKMVSWASRQYILPRELAVHSICNCRVQPPNFFTEACTHSPSAVLEPTSSAMPTAVALFVNGRVWRKSSNSV